MTEPTVRIEKLFFEVFEPLPRQGPGSRSSAKRALDLCAGLPPSPAVLDLGSGAGAQTLHLAELTTGTITAIDNHTPNIERLRAEVTTISATGTLRRQICTVSPASTAARYSESLAFASWMLMLNMMRSYLCT